MKYKYLKYLVELVVSIMLICISINIYKGMHDCPDSDLIFYIFACICCGIAGCCFIFDIAENIFKN